MKKLCLFRRFKSYLPFYPRKLFYNTLTLALFDYCDIIWGVGKYSTYAVLAELAKQGS